jgi:hypothetical protein
MSFIYFGNVPASVPATFDTTPCMKEMLQYEDCVFEYDPANLVLTYQTNKFSTPTGLPYGLAC